MQASELPLEERPKKPVDVFQGRSARIYVLMAVYLVLCCVLVLGLAYRQLVLNPIYEKQESIQSLRRVIQPGPRGNIYDRNGVLLVGNRPRFSVVAYLGELREAFKAEYIRRVRDLRERDEHVNRNQVQKEARAAVLQDYLDHVNALLGRDEEVHMKDLERHFYQRMLLPMVLIDDLSYEEYAKLIEQLPVHYPIQVYTDTARYYPYHEAAAHVLGYVGTTLEPSEYGVPGAHLTTFSLKGKVGKNGLEQSFDAWLQGESGGEVWRVDPAGYQYELVDEKAPKQGKHLKTSLDIKLQLVAEEALGRMTGGIVALDVQTGEVLAMASKPGYDLNDLSPYISTEVYEDINERGAWLNRVSQGLYPPGSPFKVICGIAFLRSGAISVDTVSNCTGTFMVGNRAFPCHSRYRWVGHGPVDLADAIKFSCNPFFYENSLKAGVATISNEALRLGLGEPTGIELPYEARYMIVPTPKWKQERGLGPWRWGDTSNMTIGQGYLMVSPLQIAASVASIARQETRTRLTLLYREDKRVDHGGEPLGLTDEQYTLVIEGMRRCALEGTSRRVQIPGLSIAAKTGTAQVKVKNGSLDVVWFIGFAPIENPQLAVVVVIEEQEGDNYHGGTTAAPVARKVFREYFRDFLSVN